MAEGKDMASDEIEKVIAETKFIDIHAHCTEYEMPPVYRMDSRPLCVKDDLIGFYDRMDVEKGAILALSNPENFIGGMSTESILRTCEQAPDRFIPSVGVDPRAISNGAFTNFEYVFKWYKDKGCKICGEVCANLHFLDPRMQNYFKGCEAVGLPLLFHIAANKDWQYGIIDEKGLPELEESLKRFPNLRFVGHSQSFWCEISECDSWDDRTGYPTGPVKNGRITELMRKYPNLYCDISAGSGNNALARDMDHAGRFLTEFADRVLFGLDICTPKNHIEKYGPDANGGRWVNPQGDTLRALLRTGRITAETYRKVARENAIKMLGLK